jgi:hypothetical protein
MKRRNDLVPQRRCTDETEDRDNDEQQGIDGDKAVPSERNHELIGVVVTELLNDSVGQPTDGLARCQSSAIASRRRNPFMSKSTPQPSRVGAPIRSQAVAKSPMSKMREVS